MNVGVGLNIAALFLDFYFFMIYVHIFTVAGRISHSAVLGASSHSSGLLAKPPYYMLKHADILIYASLVFFFDDYPPQVLTFFFLKKKGYMWGGRYCQSQQPPSPDGDPQGFVRMESDGGAGYGIGEFGDARYWGTKYNIAEFVDGKYHGHQVWYGPAGDVRWESDWLLDVRQ